MARPHWSEWWGDPAKELAYIRDMIEGLDTTRPFIFQEDGTDKGYIQVWYIRDQQESAWGSEYPWLALLPNDAVGVDLSIASEKDLSRGLGTRVLEAFVGKLIEEGHRRILIDPDPENLRAVRAYEKAGFRKVPELAGKTDDCVIMEYKEHEETEGVL